MIKEEWRLDTHLRSATMLAKQMKHHDYSVRTLAARVGSKPATIGHLRSGYRTYCDADLAKRISKALDIDTDILFVTRSSIVSREVGRAA